MTSNNNAPTSSQLKKTPNDSSFSNNNPNQKPIEERLNVWEQAASTFMALLMITLGVIMLGEVLLFRMPGTRYPVAPLYVLIFAIIFNASNFWREKLISRKINTGISISVNLAVIILLVGFTGGLNSEFYIAYFLIPTVAALCFGLKGTIISLTAIFLSLLWFLYQEPSLAMPMRIERLLFRMLLLILVSVPFLVFVERDKRHEEALAVSFRELEKALNELRETQSQLVQSSKLAALGQLSASIAHDLNQPLASMGLYAQLALSKIDNGSSVREDIEVIREQTEKIRKIVEGLRDFSRQSDFKPTPIEIRKPIDNVIKLLSPQFRMSHIKVVQNFSSDLPNIYGDENQLQQVFLNVFSNAKDALDLVDREDKQIEVSATTLLNNEFMKIMVSDNGCGIPPEIKDKIFDPFFTTKSLREGLGLGLSITSSIVHRHSGFLKIFSNEGLDSCRSSPSTSVPSAALRAGRTSVEMIFPSVIAKPCWEFVECKKCLGKDKEMCPVFQEAQGYRCWQILGGDYFKETGNWPEKCKDCKMFKKMMVMLESEGMIESRPAMSN